MFTLTQENIQDILDSLTNITTVLNSLDVVQEDVASSPIEEEKAPIVLVPTEEEAPTPTEDVLVGTKVSNSAEFMAAINTADKSRIDGVAYITLTQDILSPGPEFLIQNAKNIVVDGGGFKFYRTNNQIKNHMFRLIQCESFKFVNVGFDDFEDGVFGKIGNQNTKHMIWVRSSKNITFDNTVIANAKGYTLYIQDTDGFTFINNELKNAGILGLYVGHGDTYTSRVVIENNHFHDNSTNALALLGVGGTTTNVVRNNTFERNHIYGRWAVAPKYGTGFTGGGQFYIARANNLLVEHNTIDDGKCLNGYHRLQGKGNGDVTGIELSENHGDVIRVKNTTIQYNTITNNDGKGIGQNANSTLDKTTVIRENTLRGNGKDDKILVKANQAVVTL